MSPAPTRRAVPAATARHLRQEAAFGCCKCGLPIYEYHHIAPYTRTDPHFRHADMMILCPNHHHEATVGAMLEDEQRRLKATPYNVASGYVGGMLKLNQTYAAFTIGSVQVVGDGTFVKVDGSDLITLHLDEAGRLQISVELYDENDKLLALIERNEWIAGDPLPWDIQSKFQVLTIRRRRGSVALSVDARSEPLHVTGDLWRTGQNVRLDADALTVNGTVVRDVTVADLCLVGMGIRIDTRRVAMELVPDERFGQGAFVSWPDPAERLRRGRLAWLEIKHGASFGDVGRNDPCPCGSGKKFKRCHLSETP